VEEYVLCDFKLCKDQMATKMDILSEKSKKENPKPVTELLRLEERDLCKASVTS
jgi:hypothetical protein